MAEVCLFGSVLVCVSNVGMVCTAQEKLFEARTKVSTILIPIFGVLVLLHLVLLSATSLKEKFCLTLACMVMDLVLLQIIWLCSEITATMACQDEFITSARLRLVEGLYWLHDSDGSKPSDHILAQAIENEIVVLESYTKAQSFSLFGVSLESGRVSQFAAVGGAFLQHTSWDKDLLDPTLSWFSCAFTAMCCVFLAHAHWWKDERR